MVKTSQKKNKQKVLLTGATGFIGANILNRLLGEYENVFITVRKDSNTWRINKEKKRAEIIFLDLLNESMVQRVIKNIRPDIVIHNAVFGGYVDQKDTNKIMRTNFSSTVNLLNACKKTGFEIFINTGSSSEYGIKNIPMKESQVVEPITEYGVSKAASTLYCQALAKRDKLPIVTLRLFSPYGYFDGASRLVSTLIISALEKKAPMLSSPSSVRDFVFIEDVVDAYFCLLRKGCRQESEIINIGSGEQRSVREIAKKIFRITGVKTQPAWGKVQNSRLEPQKWVADISKARQSIGWSPKYNIDHGLEKTISWFRNNMELYIGPKRKN